jgi:uncharacterized membrane protein YqjE
VRELLAAFVALAHNRVELVATEIEYAARIGAARLLWSLVAAGVAVLALLMASILVLVLAWDSHRVLAAVVLTVLYAGVACGALAYARHLGRQGPGLLSGTLAEFRRDLARLKGAP